jgi:pimeloyl-ACP methyl ester carboxylesterase
MLDTPRKTVGPYKKLVLVGHSMGGVLIRQMTWKVFRNDYKPDASPTRGELERASVVLFAPAQGGFRLQDEVGSALASLGLSLISLWYVAKRARAYKDLVSGSPILSEIKSATAKLAGATQEALCFRAYTAWGADEIIVYKSDYDELDTRHKPYIPGIDHGGVCKPTETFDVPLTWVADGIKRAK